MGGTSSLLRDFVEGQKMGAKKALESGKDAKKTAEKAVKAGFHRNSYRMTKQLVALHPWKPVCLCSCARRPGEGGGHKVLRTVLSATNVPSTRNLP